MTAKIHCFAGLLAVVGILRERSGYKGKLSMLSEPSAAQIRLV
jgi:hypothetical protein